MLPRTYKFGAKILVYRSFTSNENSSFPDSSIEPIDLPNGSIESIDLPGVGDFRKFH